MADISFERKKSLNRKEAAVWLTALARGFADGGEVELPVGGGGVVTMRLPNTVDAEFEVEISGDEVEVELEFTWRIQQLDADEEPESADDEPAADEGDDEDDDEGWGDVR
jgi:amphi-Trp domain-containing protein